MGTGSPLLDPIELGAFCSVYGVDANIEVGSIKASSK